MITLIRSLFWWRSYLELVYINDCNSWSRWRWNVAYQTIYSTGVILAKSYSNSNSNLGCAMAAPQVADSFAQPTWVLLQLLLLILLLLLLLGSFINHTRVCKSFFIAPQGFKSRFHLVETRIYFSTRSESSRSCDLRFQSAKVDPKSVRNLRSSLKSLD